MKRSSGILLPISSLPSDHGIGTFGREAYKFADFLHAAGQKYWQVLPLGPTGYGDSPYQSFSTYAGNPYFIDLDLLVEDGLLKKKDISNIDWGLNPRYVDYGKIYKNRFNVLKKAKEAGYKRDLAEINLFVDTNKWVKEYALFMALKKHFGQVSFIEWQDNDIRLHKNAAVEKYYKELSDDVELYIYIQYLFFKQWHDLKEYVNNLGISIIGDLPIYVAHDSCDVWTEPQFFMLDEENLPVEVAGVPPDYFAKDGQLWGNPIYNWQAMQDDGYDWWVRRIEGTIKLFDVIRIDHFRGLDEYWSVPAGDDNARGGVWKKGPGMELISLLQKKFPNVEFIAENLGDLAETVTDLLNDSGWPGMKILEFAFDSGEQANFMPHTYTNHCVCYTGTHDNATIMEWLQNADKSDLDFAKEYCGIRGGEDFNWGIIRTGMESVADLFVVQMQDYLGLGEYNRMNVPGVRDGNWRWRMLSDECSKELSERIYHMTEMYERLAD